MREILEPTNPQKDTVRLLSHIFEAIEIINSQSNATHRDVLYVLSVSSRTGGNNGSYFF
jgi:hypothetical protein